MKKRDKIIYWVATVWLSLGMVSTGIVQILGMEAGIQPAINLGYPGYFLQLLGIWKILGVIAILIPKFTLVKEWAYAGFFFSMSGATISHLFMGTYNEIFPSLLLLALTLISWYFRPQQRKIQLSNA